MFCLILAVIRSLRSALMPRSDLVVENLALRHQLIVLQRRSEKPHFHRADCFLWRWRSRHRDGRPPTDQKLINLTQQMWTANPTWGSPRPDRGRPQARFLR
jgi:hypothetical protein